MSGTQKKSINILGTSIASLNPELVSDIIDETIRNESFGNYICVTGVHGIMESQRNPEILAAHNNALMCVPDGMPLVWIGRLRGYESMGRVYGPDLMLEAMRLSATKGYSHFFYGGKEGVADDLKSKFEKQFPGIMIVGTYSPPFRQLTDTEENEVVGMINGLKPDIIWIGLSTPKQELLMASWKDKVHAKLMIGVGAAFDFHTGRVRQAPKWVQNIGMEWFFRMCMEPRRLAPRYLKNNPAFLWYLLKELIKGKRNH